MINTLALNCKMVGKPANPYKALSPPWPPAKLLHMRGRLNKGRGRAWRFDYSTRGGFWVLAPSAVSNLIESSWLKGVGFPLYLGWKPRKNGWPQHERCACLLALLRAWSLRPDRLGIGVKGRGPATENGEIKQPKLGIDPLKNRETLHFNDPYQWLLPGLNPQVLVNPAMLMVLSVRSQKIFFWPSRGAMKGRPCRISYFVHECVCWYNHALTRHNSEDPITWAAVLQSGT